MGNDYQLNYLLLLGVCRDLPGQYDFAGSGLGTTRLQLAAEYHQRIGNPRAPSSMDHATGLHRIWLLVNLSLLVKTWTHQQIFWPDGWLMVYGSAISLSGIFCTAPIDNTVRYDSREAGWHSKCALMAGIAFSLCIFGYLMLSPVPLTKRVHLVFLVLVMGFSAVFGAAERQSIPIGRGIVQRLLYFTSFLWLLIGQ
jgi:hypothetical protein